MKIAQPREATEMGVTRLDKYDNPEYDPGASFFKRTVWYFTSAIFFESPYFPFFGFKNTLLRLFGAKIGRGVGMKPRVTVKHPWLLEMGDNVWIGEKVWIDNVGRVRIGNNVCISQGAMLLTGNHDYKKSTFDLRVGEITLEDGVWIGAQAVVCPGVTCRSHAVLSVGSVANRDLQPYSIYQGNPAQLKKERRIHS